MTEGRSNLVRRLTRKTAYRTDEFGIQSGERLSRFVARVSVDCQPGRLERIQKTFRELRAEIAEMGHGSRGVGIALIDMACRPVTVCEPFIGKDARLVRSRCHNHLVHQRMLSCYDVDLSQRIRSS